MSEYVNLCIMYAYIIELYDKRIINRAFHCYAILYNGLPFLT